jgi:hypothetical protein
MDGWVLLGNWEQVALGSRELGPLDSREIGLLAPGLIDVQGPIQQETDIGPINSLEER